MKSRIAQKGSDNKKEPALILQNLGKLYIFILIQFNKINTFVDCS